MIADLALLLPIPLALIAFRRLRPSLAASVVLLSAVLLLPVGHAFNFSGVPPMDRQRIAALAALIACGLTRPQQLRIRPGLGKYLYFLLLIIVGAVVTNLTNSDPLTYGPRQLRALTYYDLVSSVGKQILDFGIPFLLGMVLFRRTRDLRDLLVAIAIAGLLYTLPILYEIRMSPRLHELVYGYAQQSWFQVFRLGGWRPRVFMSHGLALSMFVLSTCLATVALWKARQRLFGFSMGLPSAYLMAVLVACKSLGAIVLGAAMVPFSALLKPRLQLRIATLLAALVLLYPALRTADIFPTERIVEAARLVSDDRAESLAFRFSNEEFLLQKARERLWFGWGGWGRSRGYSTDTGRDFSVTDGYWIIQLGAQGLVGFVGAFGILLAPVWTAQRKLRLLHSPRDRILVAGLSLIVVVNVVDLLPNSFLDYFTIFLAGVLAGVVPGILEQQRSARRRSPASRDAARVATSGSTARSHSSAASSKAPRIES